MLATMVAAMVVAVVVVVVAVVVVVVASDGNPFNLVLIVVLCVVRLVSTDGPFSCVMVLIVIVSAGVVIVPDGSQHFRTRAVKHRLPAIRKHPQLGDLEHASRARPKSLPPLSSSSVCAVQILYTSLAGSPRFFTTPCASSSSCSVSINSFKKLFRVLLPRCHFIFEARPRRN